MENPVKNRIREEFKEIESNPSDDFTFFKVDDSNPFEWQGALRGPSGTEFEGGIYHVVLQFPIEYPWKEPSFIFLTENGSFSIETKTKATLNWDPSSSKVRQAFIQLIELMPKCPDFKSDSVEEHEEKRRHISDLANRSRAAATKYGSDARQELIEANHQYMQRRCEEEVVVDPVRSTQMESEYNINDSLETRILKEYNEIESNPSYDFTCRTQSWDKYEWQYAIRGPRGTDFKDGIYHGMVQFSVGYPSKPPSIVFLTKNGCFETRTSLRLTVSSYWEPSCSVRYFLVAVIEEMLKYSRGDLVPVENNWKARRDLAFNSRAAAPKYGSADRQKLIARIHEDLLSKSPVPEPIFDFLKTKGFLVFKFFVSTFCSLVILQASNSTSSGRVVNISGITLNVNNSKWVGVFDFLKEAPNPMGITERYLVVMFFAVVLFVVWSY